jgi:hypothetical protein
MSDLPEYLVFKNKFDYEELEDQNVEYHYLGGVHHGSEEIIDKEEDY